MGLFFIAVGMSIDFGLLASQPLLIAALVLGILLALWGVPMLVALAPAGGWADDSYKELLRFQGGAKGMLWASQVGRAPYAGDTDYQLVQAHLSSPIPQVMANGTFEAELNRILAMSMAKDPAHRYQKASQMRDDLRWLGRGQAPERTVPTAASGVTAQGTHQATPASPPPPSPAFSPASPAPDPPSPSPPPPPGAGPRAVAGHTPTPTGQQRGPNNTGLIIGIAAGAVVLIVLLAVIAVAVARGGDDDTARGQTTEAPSDPEATAIANFSRGLQDSEEDYPEAAADCIAADLVEGEGVDWMIENKMLDDDLTYQSDSGWEAQGGLRFLTATFRCVSAGG
jgi:hypothetical protein